MEELQFNRGPEIVVGLVGPVGTNLDPVKHILEDEFAAVKYTVEHLRLSDLLAEIFGVPSGLQEDHDKRIKRLMDQGDSLREITDHPDAVALLAIAGIRRIRVSHNETLKHFNAQSAQCGTHTGATDLANIPLQRCAFVLHSLTTPDEVELLRKVYGASFILVAAYSRRQARINTLVAKIAKSRRDTDTSGYRDRAEILIQRDEQDKDNKKYGQNVQDTLAKADFFLDVDATATLREQISRVIKTFFGYQFHTPSQDEYGMFHAVAAARRSADLSRQVGAAIATPQGDIVAVGCNEVPKAGGGMYWEGDDHDMRDFRRGYDSSHKTKLQILNEIYGRLTPADGQSDRGLELLSKKLDGALVMNLLEFGRIIHAEMAALIDASRRGVSVKGAAMYVTTFPCHMCARHIIAAGIKRVVYIEPYPKSRVAELYQDSVSIDGSCTHANAVQFQPFVGVAPRKYMEMFEIPRDPKRKDKHTGDVIKWEAASSTPRFREFVASYVFIELRAEQYWANLLERRASAIAKKKCKSFVASGRQPLDGWLRDRATLVNDQIRTLFPEWVDRVVLPSKPPALSRSGRKKQRGRKDTDLARPAATSAA